ncbi:hypothetical protein R1sor_023872 [Riccia sorocarpa]|uniref:Uncharacterized protein n=1 Tax=Riccia sorocarpa TaxID=122646 RepID=A0ABD3GQE7_9MARC
MAFIGRIFSRIRDYCDLVGGEVIEMGNLVVKLRNVVIDHRSSNIEVKSSATLISEGALEALRANLNLEKERNKGNEGALEELRANLNLEKERNKGNEGALEELRANLNLEKERNKSNEGALEALRANLNFYLQTILKFHRHVREMESKFLSKQQEADLLTKWTRSFCHLTEVDKKLLASDEPYAILKTSAFAKLNLAENEKFTPQEKFRQKFDEARSSNAQYNLLTLFWFVTLQKELHEKKEECTKALKKAFDVQIQLSQEDNFGSRAAPVPSSPRGSSGSSTSAGTYVGIGVGAAAVVLICAGLCGFLVAKKRKGNRGSDPKDGLGIPQALPVTFSSVEQGTALRAEQGELELEY